MANWLAKFLRLRLHHPRKSEIVVVSGLPRSGTSMMMKMLAAGGFPLLTDQIRQPDEDNPEGYYEFERVKKLPKGDYVWLDQAQGKAVKIIATLLWYLPVGYTYRVIFMHRSVEEILASQRKMLARRGQKVDEENEEEMARRLKHHVQEVQNWLQSQPNIRVLNVDYNHMIKNPRRYVEQINKFLGGGLDTNKMVAVVNPRLYRNRATSK